MTPHFTTYADLFLHQPHADRKQKKQKKQKESEVSADPLEDPPEDALQVCSRANLCAHVVAAMGAVGTEKDGIRDQAWAQVRDDGVTVVGDGLLDAWSFLPLPDLLLRYGRECARPIRYVQ